MKARKVKKLDPSATLAENAARIVRVRADELTSFVPRALEPGQIKAQHDMRIAAKRLRYVLEATGFCLGRPAETARRRARDVQDVLGELHDCDVMLPRVEAHVAEMRRDDARAIRARAGDAPDLDPLLVTRTPHRTAYRGLEVLAVYLEARRELLFDRFCELWSELERKRVWERLDRAAKERIKSARELRRAADRAAKAAEELAEAKAAERDALQRARRLEPRPARDLPAAAIDADPAVAVPDRDHGTAASDAYPAADGDRAQVPHTEPA